METFHEMYFDGKVDFKGDCLETMEYRHDWANFRFTLSLFKFFLFGMIPEVIMHSRSQGKHHAAASFRSSQLTTLFYHQTKSKSATITTVVMISTVGFSDHA